MNANELANELQACFTKADWKYVDICADMLRQQQAEIEALKLKYKQEFEYVEKKFSDEWWQGVAEYNKGKAQEK
jgi:hypothetical protein